jgi:hypothetical protein
MGFASWCKVLGKALDDGTFLHDLEGKLATGGSNAQIRSWVKQKASVTLSDEDIGWLKKKPTGSDKTYVQLLNRARNHGGLNGGSGRS